MTDISVQAPNGKIILFPEGTDRATMESAMKSYVEQTPKTVEGQLFTPNGGASWGPAQNFGSGFLQGMGDEVSALGAAAKAQLTGGPSFGEAYNQAKVMYQGARKQYGEENPKTAFATDLAGQVAPWLAVAPVSAANAVGQVATKVPMLVRMLQAGKTGAQSGFVSGGLNAEGDMSDRAEGALTGTAIGGLLGGASVPLIDAAVAGGRGIYNAVAARLPFGQAGVAQRKMAEALVRDGLTPQQAAAKVASIGPDAVLADAGPNAQGLARATAGTPGEGRTAITEFVTNRQEGIRDAGNVLQGGQAGRITGQIESLVPQNYYATKAGQKATNAASDLYDSAFKANQMVESPEINLILKTPAGKQALRDAVELMQNDRSLVSKTDPELTAALKEAQQLGQTNVESPGGVGRGLKLRTLDYVKQALYDMEDAAKDQFGNATAKSRGITGLRRDLTRELDNVDVTAQAGPNSTKAAGGDYANARKLASTRARDLQALDRGQNFMSKSEFKGSQDLAADLADMSQTERDNFRIGAAQALKQKVGDTVSRADLTKKLMDIPELESKIKLAFGDDATFKKYIENLIGEKQMFSTYGKVTGNSSTAEKLAEQSDAKVDPSRFIAGLKQMASVNPLDWFVGGAKAIGGAIDRSTMSPGVSRELANLLTGTDVTALEKAFAKANADPAKRQEMARIISQISGQQAGSAQGK